MTPRVRATFDGMEIDDRRHVPLRARGRSTSMGFAFALLALVALGVLLGGCGRRRAMRAMRANADLDRRQLVALQRSAGADMSCPAEQLALVALTTRAVEVRGCGRIREYALVCENARRCTWQPITPAAVLAVRDLSCPLTSMDVEAPSQIQRTLRGCGRGIGYVLSCADGIGCRWVATEPAGPAVPPPPSGYGDRAAAPFVPTDESPATRPASESQPGSEAAPADPDLIPPPPS